MDKITRFFEAFYDEENCVFDIKKMEEEFTVSSNKNIDCRPHLSSHIGEEVDGTTREHWAIVKISKAIARSQGDEQAKFGSFDPTWFESLEDFSDYLEYFLKKDSPERARLLRWVSDKDINYKDRRNNRFCINIEFSEVTGKSICAHTNYRDRFDCHAVRFIFEYTAFPGHGDFALYDAYPVFTKEDRIIINEAKKKGFIKK